MREAIRQLCEYCPPSLTALRAHVVMLSGKTDDAFLLRPSEGLVNLEHLLANLYAPVAERVLAFSLRNGLRTLKEPQAEEPPLESAHPNGEPLEIDSNLDLDAMIRRTKREHLSTARRLSSEESRGIFVNSPEEALREIDRVLSGTHRCVVIYSYSPLIQLVSEGSPDLAPLLERLPSICRERDHVVIFAGARPHPRLDEIYAPDSQKVLRLALGGPSAGEIEAVLLEEEVQQRRPLFDSGSCNSIVAALRLQGDKSASGLKTVIDNILRDRRCFLDARWAKENGGHGFDFERLDLDAIREALDTSIIGQSYVKTEVLKHLRDLWAFGRETRAPFLRLLFVGPSGVGKTEVAKILCRNVFGTEQAMLLVACSEYSQPHEVAKLLGAPPGYTGHDQPALLEGHRRQCPAGLLLLDEFEKAHPEIQRFFLNLLEEGKATSPRSENGRPVVLDFSDYVVIATSNAGNREVDSAAARAGVAKSQAQRKALYLECLKASFPPELLGRFTDLLVFDFLSLPELQAIARHYGKLQLDRFAEICHTRGQPVPEMAVEDAFYERLASVCDAVLGARNLRGIVERAFKHTWLEQYAGRETKPTRVEFRAADIADDAELS